MSVKKKATSKKPIQKKRSKKMAVFDTSEQQKPTKTKDEPKATGQSVKEPVDPLQGIEERQAAAQEPTRKVDKGDVKAPPPKPTKLEDKKPEEMTGPEQEAMMASGGVLPKEQHDKEQATVGPTGPVMPPPPPGASQK